MYRHKSTISQPHPQLWVLHFMLGLVQLCIERAAGDSVRAVGHQQHCELKLSYKLSWKQRLVVKTEEEHVPSRKHMLEEMLTFFLMKHTEGLQQFVFGTLHYTQAGFGLILKGPDEK